MNKDDKAKAQWDQYNKEREARNSAPIDNPNEYHMPHLDRLMMPGLFDAGQRSAQEAREIQEYERAWAADPAVQAFRAAQAAEAAAQAAKAAAQAAAQAAADAKKGGKSRRKYLNNMGTRKNSTMPVYRTMTQSDMAKPSRKEKEAAIATAAAAAVAAAAADGIKKGHKVIRKSKRIRSLKLKHNRKHRHK